MRRSTFLGSLFQQTRICAVVALVMTALLIGPAVLPATAQQHPQEKTLDIVEVMPASRVPASPMLAARTGSSPVVLREAPAAPFAEHTLRASFANSARTAAGSYGGLRQVSFLPATERNRTPFQSQVRMPIHQFFGGRVELACLHTRSRHVDVHSAVPRSQLGYRLHSPYSASLAPRTRASVSLGLWFTLSRPQGRDGFRLGGS